MKPQTRKTYVSKTVAGLKPSGIRRFFDLASTMDGVISLGVGEPDFVTSWSIREASILSLEQGYTSYTPNAGSWSSAKKSPLICAASFMSTTVRRQKF
ncbi:putative N-acetyl-LL-diaminopimelate aminotransferase [Geobacillus sp. BCO2]|nr:putative N-acetyl-LL-diaminopimelate aminotransferase [Geobacillus sp. BCO2]